VEVNKATRQWYVQVPVSGHVYVADLGLKWPDGKFVSLFRSNFIRQPFGRASDKMDSQWMSVGLASEEWEIMARMALGAGSSKGASGEGSQGMALPMGIFAVGLFGLGVLLASSRREKTMSEKGYLALVLHAHLPFVRTRSMTIFWKKTGTLRPSPKPICRSSI